MIAKELISQTHDALRTSDTGEQAVTMMSIFHVKHLPIVNNEQLLGLIAENDILEQNLSEPIGSYNLSMTRPYALQQDHLFEVMKLMAEYRLTVIPVVDDENRYLGLITQDDLIQYYASSFSFEEPGSILVIETDKVNYSLAEVSRIVEEENSAILTSFLTTVEDSTRVQITLKINNHSLSGIVASLERYGYDIAASFAEDEYRDLFKDRYDSLMTYLNV